MMNAHRAASSPVSHDVSYDVLEYVPAVLLRPRRVSHHISLCSSSHVRMSTVPFNFVSLCRLLS